MKKRIYKNREKKMLCGVCAGVAEYFDIDPTIVRVIWGVGCFAWGAALIAYIVCAIVFPDKSEV
ncbi:MAG: PspC domain-containing protein [Clostridiaceae bacterium]|nr:PspC domain-containing protein [Clostridia bacterium]MDD7312630.1 PspC domain-containing protein [Clostridia bacterium]MDY3870449.1 PspC domain-containing protein [Clostridiaceae bacterium]MDY5865168.1 PspC domain-containing protein [Collinsella sp.]